MSGNDSRYFGAIEAGGTKILCTLSNDRGEIIDQTRIPTGAEPAAVVQAIGTFFGQVSSPSNPLAAIGVGSFGPLSLDPSADDYGAITATTKSGWGGFNFSSYSIFPNARSYWIPTSIAPHVQKRSGARARGAAQFAM